MSEEGNSRGVMIGMFTMAISQNPEGIDYGELPEFISTVLKGIGEKPLSKKEEGAIYAVLGKVLLHVANTKFGVTKP